MSVSFGFSVRQTYTYSGLGVKYSKPNELTELKKPLLDELTASLSLEGCRYT
jgi:hypothetical protein